MSLSPAQWSAVQTSLKGQVGEDDFNSWLASLELEDRQAETAQDDSTVTLAVPTRFMQDWIHKHYGKVIETSFHETLKKDIAIHYVVKPALAPLTPEKKEEAAPEIPAGPVAATPAQADGAAEEEENPLSPLAISSTLDPHFTFETFVTGKSNDFAFAAAQRISESADCVYNPFFLHGGVGLGKTHLMHAIGNHIQTHRPGTQVLYISAEQFVNQFVQALKNRTTMSFKNWCRSVDVLMVDDIQFIAGKNATQEEFFHTFNALVSMGKQVILTADRSPHEMDNIEDRLRSRLGCGLTCQIHAPEMETRLAILQHKAEEISLNLPEDVAMFLADGISSNVRELEGALNRLAAHASLTGSSITLDLAQEQLRDLFRANTRFITLDDIQRKVADYYNLRIADLHGPRRLRSVARPRQTAMFLAKKLTTKSYPDIGKSFGGRDHTTVIHAVRTIENLLPREPGLAEDVKLLEKMLTVR